MQKRFLLLKYFINITKFENNKIVCFLSKALFTLGTNDYKHCYKNDAQHVAWHFSFIVTAAASGGFRTKGLAELQNKKILNISCNELQEFQLAHIIIMLF